MGFKDIMPGNKIAKARSARWVRPKATLGLEIEFDFHEPKTATYPGGTEQRSWVAWFPHDKPESCERSMKVLHDVLGFNGDDSCVADGPDQGKLTNPKAFDWDREVQIVIEMETYEGKTYPKIAWVNKLGGSQFAACEPTTLKNDLGAIGFKGLFLAAKKSAGEPVAAKPSATATLPAPMQSNLPEEKDLPF